MEKVKKILAAATVGILLLSRVSIPAFATPVQTNGSFEQNDVVGNFNTVSAPDNGVSIPSWSVSSGSVDHIDGYWPASAGDQSIDLNGLAPGTISQTLTTQVGATYNVSFDMSGNPDSSDDQQFASPANKDVAVNATNGGSTQHFFFDTSSKLNTRENMMWETMHYSFVASSTSSVLSFTSNTAGAFGPAIDNVVIDEVSPTPTVSPTETPTVTPSVSPSPTGVPIPSECPQNVTYNVIQGTAGSDVLNGTNGPDLILAGAGSDVVNGKGGNDCIVGGSGSDSLHGQTGNDVILGGDDSDAIQGDEGDDWLYGQDGSDSIKGASGNDHMFGGNGSDSLKGDGGTDNADGGLGSDACNAEAELSCEG